MPPANHHAATAATLDGVLALPASGEIHLWRADLDRDDADPACLNDDERARAARFRTTELTRRFTAGRVFLRQTLALYLDCTPEALIFTYGPFGKPGLERAPFEFNLSHSQNLAVLAVARETVGVDIEHPDPDADLLGMARQVMSPEELQAFEALPAPDQPPAFYALWTAKEALIKALGTGFSRDARTLHVGWGDRLEVSDGWRAFQLQALGLSTPAAIAMAGRIGAVHLLT